MPAEKSELLQTPFDQFQRYRVIQEVAAAIKEVEGLARLRVVDVGGHYRRESGEDGAPIRSFLPDDDCVCADVTECRMERYVRARGEALPFRDGAADLVTCSDVLEHVSPELRKPLVLELLRVSRGYVVLSAPFDSVANRLAEKLLFEYIRKTLGGEHQQLKEHLELGIPSRNEVEELLRRENAPFCTFPSGYLFRWLPMMIFKHHLMSFPDTVEVRALTDEIYNRHFFEADQREPAYRQVYVVSARNGGGAEVLERVARRFAPAAAGEDGRSAWIEWSMVLGILDVETRKRSETELGRLTAELERLRRENEMLWEFRRKVQAALPYRAYSFGRRLLGGEGKPD